MQDSIHSSHSKRWLLVLLATVLASGCANHCGFFNYCDIPKNWPLTDTFSVQSVNNQLCVSGAARSSCASKGIYQSGSRAVDVYSLSEEEDETESYYLATLRVVGTAGAQFRVSCFQYNGNRVLGFTEVLIGVEIHDHMGLVVAMHPSHSVVRRGPNFMGC